VYKYVWVAPSFIYYDVAIRCLFGSSLINRLGDKCSSCSVVFVFVCHVSQALSHVLPFILSFVHSSYFLLFPHFQLSVNRNVSFFLLFNFSVVMASSHLYSCSRSYNSFSFQHPTLLSTPSCNLFLCSFLSFHQTLHGGCLISVLNSYCVKAIYTNCESLLFYLGHLNIATLFSSNFFFLISLCHS